jgi:hypothetical protein
VGLCVSSPQVGGCRGGEREGQGVDECVGLGVVRAIDPEKRLLYVMTPVDIGELQRVDVLVRARGKHVSSVLFVADMP